MEVFVYTRLIMTKKSSFLKAYQLDTIPNLKMVPVVQVFRTSAANKSLPIAPKSKLQQLLTLLNKELVLHGVSKIRFCVVENEPSKLMAQTLGSETVVFFEPDYTPQITWK